MAANNSTRGPERIANEMQLEPGILVSSRTVAKGRRHGGLARTPDPKQRWLTVVHHHAQGIVACDLFVVMTAAFRILHVFVRMDEGSRRIFHHQVTAHPTAEWTLHRFRETLPGHHPCRCMLHGRDSIERPVKRLGGVRISVRPCGHRRRMPAANAPVAAFAGSLWIS